MSGARVVGSRARRIEDPALLAGCGEFLDDVRLEGTLHAAFVRSPHAHAQVGAIDASRARSIPGVVAVLTAADLEPRLHSLRLPIAFPEGQMPPHVMPWVLTATEVCHVGEAVAMVLAETRHVAEDAADAIVVDWRPLPAVADARDALAAGAPKARLDPPGNVFKQYAIKYGDADTAFARAAHVVGEELVVHRGLASSLEGRGVLARWDGPVGTLTVWSSTQMSHELFSTVAEMLGLDENAVRIIAPDVGGGFGAKYMVYPEEIAVAAASVALGRPVKWVEDRREHFVSAIQERDQFWAMEMALDGEGRILGMRGRMIHDQGAYAPHSYTVAYNASTTVCGPYVVPAFDLDVVLAQTNKPPVIPVRGAGYPQGNFVMERLLDRAARELAIDRAVLRSRNYIPQASMPYPTPMKNRAGVAIVYDSGDYQGTQDEALRVCGYAGFRARQRQARAEGRYIGLGIAAGVKGTGRGPYESGTVRISNNGRVSIYTGALAMGQGIKTALAQICADELGVAIETIDVIAGDTRFAPLGMGGYASRQAITAGSAVFVAAREVREKAVKVAAQMLEAAEQDLVVSNGRVHLAGVPDHGVSLGKIASRLRGLPGYSFPAGVTAGLEATHYFHIDALSYSNAFHAVEVEVDVETGCVRILRYVAVQDSGKLINPNIAEGQIHGSIVHGIGNALFEYMAYDAAAQPLTTTFADYLLPVATEMPHLEVIWRETPSPLNPLGIKGVAESGIVCVGSAIASAIDDALAPFGVVVRALPVTPMRLLELIDAGRATQAA